MSTVFTKSYAKESDGAVSSQDFAVVGTSADGTVYHWVFHIRLANNGATDNSNSSTRSVVIDMSPGVGTPPVGILIVSSAHEVATTGPDTLVYPFDPTTPLTPDAFLSFLIKHGLHKFYFTPEGTGCRNWCKSVLEKMEEEGLARASTAEWFQGWLEAKSAEVGADRIPLPGARGEFYA